MVRQIVGKYLRRRMVPHFGEHDGILDELEEYGIMRRNVPTDLSGDFDLPEEFGVWLRERNAIEIDREGNGYYE